MRDADASPLVFGNLNTTRDFLDVRDVANAYISLATCGKSGEVYNICSGTERSMCDALLTVFNLAGAPLGDDFATDKDGGRQNDTERMLGSNNKLRSTTGWVQKYNFEESIRDTIDYWRGIIHD
jgi:GDP-4-dehydro-6-deoxy-D-mannose reductase